MVENKFALVFLPCFSPPLKVHVYVYVRREASTKNEGKPLVHGKEGKSCMAGKVREIRGHKSILVACTVWVHIDYLVR